jgi:hypothetical protein
LVNEGQTIKADMHSNSYGADYDFDWNWKIEKCNVQYSNN